MNKHLVDTKAVRPLPNPKFDPSRYDATLEGKAPLKNSGNRNPKNPVLALRIDPSRKSGKIEIHSLHLTTTEGKVLQQWEF
ncbi:hypothetical protein OAM01_01035 [bacterium]|nr:hypothetical protein [bacterium]